MPTFKAIGCAGLDAVRHYLGKIPDDGRRRRVTIVLHKEKRSISQNALYHMWVGIIADETGHSHDDLHEAFKAMFLGRKTVKLGGSEPGYLSRQRASTRRDLLIF